MEIERKFVLDAPPPRERLGSGVPVEQGYLGQNIRLRRKGLRCYLTVKGEGTLAREEWEVEVPAWVFEQLWPETALRRVAKTRHAVPHGELTLEIDEYHGRLAGLWTLECEFSDEQTARAYQPPAWAGPVRDVTADLRYRNVALAEHGIPSAGSGR